MKANESRKRRSVCSPVAESLETRQVLSGGAGNTVAIIPTEIAKAGSTAQVQFTISPTNFTAPRSGKILMGIAAVANSSDADPRIAGVTEASGKRLRLNTYAQGKAAKTSTGAAITPSSVAELNVGKKAATKTFTLNVKSKSNGTGAVLTGFYLVGDVDGNGKVDKTDMSAIKKVMGTNATSANYDFNADANRDGKVTRKDLQLAQKNLGAASSIMPLITADLNPTNSSRIVTTSTAELKGVASSGANITYTPVGSTTPSATAKADDTGNYNIKVPLQSGSNNFTVASTDSFGQTISGSIAAITYKPITSSTT